MYIILTNANPAYRGTQIALNSDLIQSIHTSPVLRETGETENVTFVFCPPHGTWEVTEPTDYVVSVLNTQWNK
jgi:hypothetical protein